MGDIAIQPGLREQILATPDVILDDSDLMRALVDASDDRAGPNVVDLRARALERLETRLGRLEETHRSVIANAHDNVAGMNLVHRAVLALLEADGLDAMMANFGGVADALSVDTLRLVIETPGDPAVSDLPASPLRLVTEGAAMAYLGTAPGALPRRVTLRRATDAPAALRRVVHELCPDIADGDGSEACLALDLGAGRMPGLIVMGSLDPDHFLPGQATDLLAFFAGVGERVIQRWLE